MRICRTQLIKKIKKIEITKISKGNGAKEFSVYTVKLVASIST